MVTQTASQLSLFEESPVVPAGPMVHLGSLTWSHARRSTLERCCLQYYFDYFGANKRTAKADPAKEELHLLKSVASRHERTGWILHLVIAWYLRESQRGAGPDVERLTRWARQLFESDRTYSRLHPDGGDVDSATKYPAALLREYHYRHPDAEQLCDEAEERLITAVHSFATDPLYAQFRVGGSSPEALIEHAIKLPAGLLPCKVDGRIDLAYGDPGSATIVDWKLGDASGVGDESLQLAVYALWAVTCFGCDPASLRICRVHFGSHEIADFHFDAGVLADAQARITQDAMRMAAMEGYGRAGVAEAFTPCALPGVCNGCRYQRACPAGKEFINHA